MPECNANATWSGSLMDGDGDVAVGSGILGGRYAMPSEPEATNPEELLGAAHATCFAMTASYALNQAGFTPDDVQTDATVTLEQDDDGFEITSVELTAQATVPDATEAEFTDVIAQAEEACPVSKVLEGTEVEVDASLLD